MVLWEITLGTAYFLGLKRTYKLALKIQRRLISPDREKIRQFVQRRTRAIFDVAVKVHRTVQERDIEVGRNLGNWILRWLDKKRPQAHIRGGPHPHASLIAKSTSVKQSKISSLQKTLTSGPRIWERDSGRQLFTAAKHVWPRAFPAVAMIMRRVQPNTQFRQLCISSPRSFGDEGIVRKDILQWMMQN